MHGINVNPINDWQYAWPFIDLMEGRRAWTGTAKISDDNWPVGTDKKTAAGTITGFPLGKRDYTMRVASPGKVTAARFRQGPILYPKDGVLNFTFDAANNPSVGVNVDVAGDKTVIQIAETNLLPLLDRGEVFRPDYLAQVKPFATIRFMDWADTNAFAPGPRRAALAAMLCNATGAKEMIWNIHWTMTRAQVIAEISEIISILDPDIMLTLELHNEVWGGIAQSWNFAKADATKGWSDTDLNNGQKVRDAVDSLYGQRASELALIVMQVSPRPRMLLSQQFRGPGRWTKTIEGWDKGGAPRWMIRGMATAAYFGGVYDAAASLKMAEFAKKKDVAGAVAMMAADVEVNAPIFAKHVAAAKAVGAHVVNYQYEYNSSTPARSNWIVDKALREEVVIPFLRDLNHGPQVAALNMRNMANGRAAGVTGPWCAYNLAGPGTEDGQFGLTPHDGDQTGFATMPLLMRQIASEKPQDRLPAWR
jgi:hypothetical protein